MKRHSTIRSRPILASTETNQLPALSFCSRLSVHFPALGFCSRLSDQFPALGFCSRPSVQFLALGFCSQLSFHFPESTERWMAFCLSQLTLAFPLWLLMLLLLIEVE